MTTASFSQRDFNEMTKSQALQDWDDIKKVLETPQKIDINDIDVYRDELKMLNHVVEVLLIAREGNTLNQIDY